MFRAVRPPPAAYRIPPNAYRFADRHILPVSGGNSGDSCLPAVRAGRWHDRHGKSPSLNGYDT
jgi:hypothetical protein